MEVLDNIKSPQQFNLLLEPIYFYVIFKGIYLLTMQA